MRMGFCLYLQKKNLASTTGIVSETSSPTLSTTSGTNYPVGSLPSAGQVENNQFGFPSTAVPFAGADPTIPATQLEEVQVTGTRTPKQDTQPQAPEEHWYNTFGAMLQAIPKSVYETVGNVLKTEENSLKQKTSTKSSTPKESEGLAKDYFKSVLGFFGDNMDTADAIKMGSPVTAIKTLSDKIVNSGMSTEDKNRAIKELAKAQTVIQGRVGMMNEYAARNPYPQNLVTNTAVGVSGMLPDIATANLGGAGATGEAMAAKVARMTEGAPAVIAKYAPKAAALLERAVKAPFTKVMAAKGAAEGGAKNEANPLLGVTTGTIKGAGEGIYMHVLGEGAGKVSPYIAKVIGKTGATSEISTALANPLANAGVFTAAKAIRTPLEEGRLATTDELAHEAAMGIGFSLLHAGQTFKTHQEANHFYENTLKTDPPESLGRVLNEKPENILRDYDPNLNVKDLTEARNELKEAIVKEPDLAVKKQLGDEALKIQNQLDAKEAVEGIVKDKDALIEMVDKLPELTPDQKQAYIQNIEQIAKDYDPAEVRKSEINSLLKRFEANKEAYTELLNTATEPSDKIELQKNIEDMDGLISSYTEDLKKLVFKPKEEIKPVEEVKPIDPTETTTQTEGAVTDPKTASNEETNQVTEQQVPKTEETGTTDGKESVKAIHEINKRRDAELEKEVVSLKPLSTEEVANKDKYDADLEKYNNRERIAKDINAKYDKEIADIKPVAKPKFTIKGETVTPKVEENVNTLNEPIVGGETKDNAEAVQPTSNDKGGNGTQAETVAEETVKPSFDELATRSLEGDVIKNTLSNVERETNTKLDKNISEYNAADFKSAFVQGEQTVQAAKEEFGKDYVSKFTDYVKDSKMPFENKAVMLVSLENDLRKQYLENPTPQLKKQVDLATKNSIEFLRSSARATGVGIFRQAARANYETESAAEAIFSPKERQERTKVEEAVQSTSEDVQKEYEARQETQTDTNVQEAIDKGVQARIDDIYEALPSSRKQAADKAISALERIQKKLRSKTYDASIGVPIAIIDAGISTIKQAIKAGVKVADAIELGINKIKEKYGKTWKNEDKFRKDMLEGFSEENIDIQDGTRTSKTTDKLKQELIDAGYGKEITVTTKNGKEKRNIIDWKKLTGVEGSFDRMKENLEESLKKKGYSEPEINEFQKQLEDEYNDIHADIIQKSLNELNRRNTPREATAKTLARRLAELYNLGLYDRDVDTYSNILNNALGISPKSQAAFNEIRDFNRSLAQLLDSRGVNGKRLTDLEIITAENEIKAHIQKVIQKVQFAEGNGFFKFSDVMKNIFSAMQRMMLAKVSQLVENPFSGALNDTQVKLQDAFSKGKWDTKELKENRAMLGRAIYEDASLRGGDEYGGVGNPFTSKNSIESFVNGLSKNAMYQSFVGMLSGRQYLDATDSYFKIKRTEKEFTNNLLRILTDKSNPNGAMEQNDALRFVSESLTGQSFSQAKETARGIIESINDKAGKEIIRPAETNVTRIANDLVKDNLVLGGKMTMNEVESAFKAAYKTAGKSIGHESNNLLTDVVNATNQTIQRKLDEALKKKDWSTAAVLNLTSILSKNIVNPFVGGGTNWTVIGLQKMGLPTEWIRSDVGFSKKPIDLGTKEGLKELQNNLSANATRQRQFGRIMTGTLTALAAVMAVRYSGDEDDYKKWLKAHPDTRKLINKIQPVPLTLYLARDNKKGEFIKAIASTLGSRYNAQTDADKLYAAVNDFWEGYNKGNEKKTKKAWGTVGQLMGRRVNIPYVSSISNYVDAGDKLYKEFVGKPVKDPYKSPKGFVDGYFKGGLMDYLNITPQDLKEDKK